MLKTGALLTCQASAVGIGLEGALHLEALGLVVPPPAGEERQVLAEVALMDEGTGHTARTAVEVLVAAPAREVHVPVVQLQVQVAGGMREIEADIRPHPVRSLGDRRHVEGLAGVEVHAAETDQRQLIAQLVDLRHDVLGAQGVLTGTGLHFHQIGLRITAMEGDL